MTNRERFEKIVRFEKVDRPLRWETLGFWSQTVKRWSKESGFPPDTDPSKYYEMDPWPRLPGNVGHTSISYHPLFEAKVIKDEGRTKVCRNAYGITSRVFEDASSMPQWLRFPVETPQDWENIKWRIDPDTHDYGDFEETKGNFIHNPDPNGLYMCGLYGFYRNLFGEEKLAYAFYDYPETIQDMGKQWLKFYAEVGGRIIRECRCDYLMLWEDMAYKNGPLISPDLFREFMIPYYKELVSHFRGLGVKTFCVDSDGNNDVLIPLFCDMGMNMMVPFEVAAGNDVRNIRERWPELVIWGGIDKRFLKREVMEKVPVMWEKGGYIPCLDHSTQPCPRENWEYYLEILRGLFK